MQDFFWRIFLYAKGVIWLKMTPKNIVVMFIFVVVAVLAAKAIGNKIPAIGQYTNQI